MVPRRDYDELKIAVLPMHTAFLKMRALQDLTSVAAFTRGMVDRAIEQWLGRPPHPEDVIRFNQLIVDLIEQQRLRAEDEARAKIEARAMMTRYRAPRA